MLNWFMTRGFNVGAIVSWVVKMCDATMKIPCIHYRIHLWTIKIILNGGNSIKIYYGPIVFEVWHLPHPDSVVVVKGSKTITYEK